MSERSANLDMPYLLPSQAQKHVTHNEALQHLDAVVQTVVRGFAETTPPTAPEPGECHALGAGATGDWTGRDAGDLAYWTGAGWLFVTPREGWRAWGTDAAELRVFQGGAWVVAPLSELGVNTDADSINRLAVASEATLLTHDGSGHQLKINKSASTDTASLLFQSGWTGHAEMGLAGNDDWSLKVSPDGTAWTEALVIDKDTGNLGVGAPPPDGFTRLYTAGEGIQLVVLESTDGGPMQLRFKSDSGNRRFLAVNNADNTEVQITFENDAIALCGPTDSGTDRWLEAKEDVVTVSGAVQTASYTVATLPSASTLGAGAMIFVSDETGGATMAFSDGTDWRRVQDRAIVS